MVQDFVNFLSKLDGPCFFVVVKHHFLGVNGASIFINFFSKTVAPVERFWKNGKGPPKTLCYVREMTRKR